jgi:hypothetical protein
MSIRNTRHLTLERRERIDMDFYTLQDFYTHTKGIAYILIVVTLLGMAGFWLYLTDQESDDEK